MKDEFLATVSHELRTPLTAILGWARILRDSNYDRVRVTKGVEIIERNARAQVRIVEDILDISRIITGKVKLELVPIDPRLVIEAAVSTLESTAGAGGVELQVRMDPELGSVLGDGERLQQVLWNLLSNAIKFTPGGGKVEVVARREGEALEIAVRDTGRGIAPGFLPHVFERFRQDDTSSTRSIGGLGLGLAIVRQLVELHRGTVTADSDGHGRGSTFTVHLPTFHGPPLPPPPLPIATSPEQKVALIGLCLLVVDDEQDTRDLLTTIFEASGARVTAVGSAREGLAQLQAGGVDLLVSDISMPGEDGFWLIHRVRACTDARLQRMPALALTAYARAEDRHRVHGAGFQVYLSKPIHPEELVKVVGDLAARLVVRNGAPS
jgi:CheY-like chemotaxis protein/anti-sigma regulatory factor (Ser/Thr protein kinase)